MTLNNKEKLEKSENKVNKINNEFYKKQTKIKIDRYFSNTLYGKEDY